MRPGTALVLPAARRDLPRLAEWLRQEADPETAARVISAARRSFDKLAENPGLGAPAEAKLAALSRARRWHVDGFPNHLIFYEAGRQGGGVILRILHAAQDRKRR